jgi:four helix bundle protein
MPGVQSFTDLKCWQEARAWSKAIFQQTRTRPFANDRRLVEQINDSSESVMSNIAEGFGRGTQGEFILFLGYALGSLDETRSHLVAAYDREFLAKPLYETLFRQGTTTRKMTVGLITSMIRPGGGVKFARRVKSWSDEVWELYERVTGKPRPELYRTHAEDNGRPPRNDTPPG